MATINTNEDWKAYLRFQSQFYHYSYGNAILIYLQSGGKASYVKGYKAWNKLGRYVRKGSRGLAILAPCIRKVEVFKEPDNKVEYHDAEGEKEKKQVLSGFRIAYVYDICDTDGDDSLLPVLVRGLAGNTDSEKEIYDRLFAVISKEYVIQEVVGTSSKGSYNLETGVISVRSDLKEFSLSNKEWVNVKTILNGMYEYARRMKYISESPMPNIRITVRFRQIVKKTGRTQTYNTEELANLTRYLDKQYRETDDVALMAGKT